MPNKCDLNLKMNEQCRTSIWFEKLNEDQIAKQIYEGSVYGSGKKGNIEENCSWIVFLKRRFLKI